MKKYIYLLCTLLSLGLYGCSGEESEMGGTDNRITVSFTLPDEGPSTRAEVTTPATDEEKALKKVDLYCFDYTGGAKGVLEKIIELSEAEVKAGNPAIELTKGDYYIEAIANEPQTLPLTVGTHSYADYQTLRANMDNYANWLTTDGIRMRGGNSARVTNAGNLNINFTMIRMVGRVDVLNRVPGLTITKALVENSVKESFYLEDATSAIAAETGKLEQRVVDGLSVATNASAFLFYTYEGAVEVSGLQVSFEGVSADGTLHKSLPVATFTNENAQPAIKRNKLYVVELVEVDGTIQANVRVTDWNQKAIEAEVTVEKELEVTVLDVPEGMAVSKNPAQNGDEVTITLPAAGATLSFQAVSSNLEVEAVMTTPDAAWLTISETGTRSMEQAFTMVATANEVTTAREATFVLRNKLTHRIAVTYHVTQLAAPESEPEPGVDWDNDYPVVNQSGAATLEQWVESEDAVGANGKMYFMCGTVSPAVDETSPVTDFDQCVQTWYGRGDPSRSGYHMATKADWTALGQVYAKASVGSYLTFNGKHYYFSYKSLYSGKLKLTFQECDDEQKPIGTKKTIEFGGGGSIKGTYKSTSPWNCTKVQRDNYSRYWCGGSAPVYYVELSYGCTPQTADFGNSSKGMGWRAMRIRSIKNN